MEIVFRVVFKQFLDGEITKKYAMVYLDKLSNKCYANFIIMRKEHNICYTLYCVERNRNVLQ